MEARRRHDANFCLDDVGKIEVGKKLTVKGEQQDFLTGVAATANKLASLERDNLFDRFTLGAALMSILEAMVCNKGKGRPVAMSGVLLQRSFSS